MQRVSWVIVLAFACRGVPIEPESDTDSESGADTDTVVDTDSDTDTDSDSDTDTALDPVVGRVYGSVLLPDGAPAAGALVAVADLADVADAAGAFDIDDVPPGTWEIRAESSGWIAAIGEVEVVAGQDTTLTLTLGAPDGDAPIISSLAVSPSTLRPGATGAAVASATDPDGGDLTYAWEATGGFAIVGDGATAELTAPDQPDAEGVVRLVVTDADGDTATADVPVVTASNAAPIVSSLTATPSPVARGGTVALSLSASDADGDDLDVAWTAPAGWTLVGSGPDVTLTAPGDYGATGVVSARVSDRWGAAATATVAVATIGNQPPTIGSVVAEPPTVARGGTLTARVVASDPEGGALDVEWAAPNGWTVLAAGSANTGVVAPGTPGATATLRVRVTDDGGASVDGEVLVAVRSNVPPIVRSLVATPVPAEPRAAVTVAADAVDSDDTELTWAWTVPPGWILSGSGSTVSLAAPGARGDDGVVRVEVTDPHGGRGVASVAVSTADNLSPVIASVTANPPTLAPGGTASLRVDATDPNGDPLTVAWTLPSGWTRTGDGAAVDVTAPGAEGVGTIRVGVTDPYGGTSEGSVVVPVVATNVPPDVALDAGAGTVRPLSRRRLVATATDADGDDLTFTWSVVGAGYSIDGTGPIVDLVVGGPTAIEPSALVRVEVRDGEHLVEARATVVAGVDGASCADVSGSGMFWMSPNGTVASSYPVACDAVDGGGWMLAYKRSAGVASADVPGDFRSGNLNPTDVALLDRDRETRDYSGPAMLDWSRFGEARVEVVVGGQVRQWMTFDTVGSTPSNFFDEGRITGSSWTNIVAEHVGPAEYWSLAGDPASGRSWYLNRRWDGCPNDEGWLLVRGNTTGPCSFDAPNIIRFADDAAVQNTTSGRVANADALLVWVRPAAPGRTRASALATCKAHYDAGARTDGAYFVDPDGASGAAPFRTFCDMTNGGWTMIYKKSSGVARDPYDAWVSGNVGVSDFAALSRARHVGDFATPGITSGWSAWSAVRVEALVSNAPAAQMTFGVTGASNVAWFSAARVTGTNFTDLGTQGQNYFSVEGDSGNRRRFFVNRNYGGCGVDAGWLIAGGGSPPCSWETPYTVKFARGNVVQNWNDAPNIGVADGIAVFAR